MHSDLLALIQLGNPWLLQPERFPAEAHHRTSERWIARTRLEREDWPARGKANLLIGGRQVGKSSALWRRCIDRDEAPLFVNAEEPAIREWSRSPTRVLDDLRGLLRPGMPVLLEEAQQLPEAGLLCKGLIDGGLEAELLVTGSSAFHLKARTRESLAGRAARATLFPLSLVELSRDLDDLPPILRADAIRRRALEHMVRGGYPEVWLAERPEDVARKLLEAFVIRDASDLFRVQHLDVFRRLLQLLAGQAGSLSNRSEWATVCEVSSETVRAYVDILVETHVAFRVFPFAGGKRAELTSRPKVYLADSGIRSVLVRRWEPFSQRVHAADRGATFESWVGGELRKHLSPLLPGDELRYWRTRSGAEIDFVIPRPDGVLAFEAKATAMKRPKLTRSARSFIDAYQPRAFYVVNLALEASERLGETQVHWVPPEALATPARLGLGP